MGNCWRRHTSLKINCFHSLSFLPEVSLQNFSAESRFCLYLLLNKPRVCLPQSEFRDVTTAGYCCPELLQLLPISFFRLFSAVLVFSDLCNMLLLFISVSFSCSKGGNLFHFYPKVCLGVCVCVLLIPPAEIKLMLNNIGRTFLTHQLCISTRDLGVTELMNKHRFQPIGSKPLGSNQFPK